MKNQQLIEELEKSLDDKVEKEKLVEGFLGYIICSTQVISSHLNNIFCIAENIKFDGMVLFLFLTKHHSYLCRKQWCYRPMSRLLSG